jgi:hypothetical protein
MSHSPVRDTLAVLASSKSPNSQAPAPSAPAPGDPRVLRFDQVTPVVFSETIGDLKAIIATKE